MEHQTSLPIENKYYTNWAKYNLAKTNEKRLFYELLNELCKLIPEPPYNFGRPSIPVRDMVFISGLKLYNNFSSRKVHTDVEYAKHSGYITYCPHFNRISEFFNSNGTYELLQRLLKITAMPLKSLEDDYSMDSSGFGAYQYERWMRARYQNKRGWRNYLKGHICIGTRTNIIISAEVTYGNRNDAKEAIKLLKPLEDFKPKTVSADKAYSSYKILKVIDSMGANPFIPFKSNTNPSLKSPRIWKRTYRYFLENQKTFMDKYHKRSNVETTFAMIKTRLGEFLRSKNYEAQRNELLMKFIVHNITCLVSEIFENEINVNFKETLERYIQTPKDKELIQKFHGNIGRQFRI